MDELDGETCGQELAQEVEYGERLFHHLGPNLSPRRSALAFSTGKGEDAHAVACKAEDLCGSAHRAVCLERQVGTRLLFRDPSVANDDGFFPGHL